MENMPAEYRDIDWEGLTHARRALIGNPFTTPPEDLRSATEWFVEHAGSVPRAMLGLLASERARDAKKLALAAAHSYARVDTLDTYRLNELRKAVDAAQAKGGLIASADVARVGLALARFHKAARALVGTSAVMQAIRQDIWTLSFGPNLYETLARESELRRLNVLILGETGTGKELIADALQAAAFTREDPPMYGVNCAALPELLAESELFGVVKGAHSTATTKRQGKLAASDGGTFFLDEVADLPPEVQVKLLSVLQNGKVTPLGANEFQKVDVRYIAATSRPLSSLVKEDEFRLDLYQRLATYVIEVPPLRQRPEDIVAIGRHILGSVRDSQRRDANVGRDISSFDTVMAAIESARKARGIEVADSHFYGPDELWLRSEALHLPWTGNVRELDRVLRQRMMGLSSRGDIEIARPTADSQSAEVRAILAGEWSEAQLVEWYTNLLLEKFGGNVTKTTERLGINRSTYDRRKERPARTGLGKVKAE